GRGSVEHRSGARAISHGSLGRRASRRTARGRLPGRHCPKGARMMAAPEAPFPGAPSQVTGRPLGDGLATPRAPASPGLLPLEASLIDGEGGCIARLPVRAEDTTIEKRTVV